MAEGIRAIQHLGSAGAESFELAAAGEQIAHHRLAARDELVGEHVPRPRLEASVTQQRGERIRTVRPHVEIVAHHDGLAIEQETLIRTWRIVYQLVDQRNEALLEARERLVPFAIPVGVHDDVHIERRRRIHGGRRARVWGITRPPRRYANGRGDISRGRVSCARDGRQTTGRRPLTRRITMTMSATTRRMWINPLVT